MHPHPTPPKAHAPGCPTTTWQPAYGVGGGMPLVLLESTVNSSMPLGFCQSSQPLWSAYRDPRYGPGLGFRVQGLVCFQP